MRLTPQDRSRLWLVTFFAGMLALLGLAAWWWTSASEPQRGDVKPSAPVATAPLVDPIAAAVQQAERAPRLPYVPPPKKRNAGLPEAIRRVLSG